MEKKKSEQQSGEQNQQIVCRVQNCAYHCGDCTCTANQIAVGPTYAPSGKDTVCATFKPKEL
ncbi:MAG: DUF1540 domain-containing protein [Eubacteriales bacterium]